MISRISAMVYPAEAPWYARTKPFALVSVACPRTDPLPTSVITVALRPAGARFAASVNNVTSTGPIPTPTVK